MPAARAAGVLQNHNLKEDCEMKTKMIVLRKPLTPSQVAASMGCCKGGPQPIG